MPLSDFSAATRDWFIGRVRAADAGPGPGVAGDRVGRARPDLGADRLGQDARRVPVGDRPGWPPSRADGEPAHRPRLRLAAEGAVVRHRPQPAHAAARHRRRSEGRGAHRRHAAARAPADAARAARHPDHDARVAVPDADRPRAGAVRRRALVHRRRDPRGRRDQARRAPGADARAADRGRRARGAADRAVGARRTRSRRSAASWSDRGAPAGSSTPACARSSTSRSRSRSSRWSSPTQRRRPTSTRSPAAEATRRSIWPAIYPELLELIKQHRSTILFVNNRRGAERLALRLNDLAERGASPARTTARWRARSARSSRRCSRPASCRAWSRPLRSSSGSTWARSIS